MRWKISRVRVAAMALFLAVLPVVVSGADYGGRKQVLLNQIESELRELADIPGIEPLSARVRGAMEWVERHRFVSDDLLEHAYENRPLYIGYGQTISQPLIVALMTDLLGIEPGERVFELGTGSGYQAAVLAELGAEVYSMEIIEPLAEEAGQRLQALGYTRVKVRLGDGYNGWPEAGPFDAIIVTAAGDHIPTPLVAQLKPGGRMIVPVGGRYLVQQLVLVTKGKDGELQTRNLLPVRFVPITGGH
jgi:protein-L-isoaspartate(D-aspartate) O-methyltransferase